MKALEQEIAAATAWLFEQAERVPYGEVSVMLVLHGGRLSRVERSVTAKIQPEEGCQNERIPS